MNRVILIGRAGSDPEVRHTPSGDSVCNLSLATSEKFKDKNTGERRENTEWHRLVFFGKLAEVVGQWVKKGSQISVEGAIRTRKWQDQAGQDRYTTEIRCENMEMLGSRQDGGGDQPAPQQQQQRRQEPDRQQRQQAPSQQSMDDFDDDIPF